MDDFRCPFSQSLVGEFCFFWGGQDRDYMVGGSWV